MPLQQPIKKWNVKWKHLFIFHNTNAKDPMEYRQALSFISQTAIAETALRQFLETNTLVFTSVELTVPTKVLFPVFDIHTS